MKEFKITGYIEVCKDLSEKEEEQIEEKVEKFLFKEIKKIRSNEEIATSFRIRRKRNK